MNTLKKSICRLTGYWMHKTRFLPPGVSLFDDLSRRFGAGRVSVIFDVGANTGQTVRYFRNLYPMAEIHAFEPVSETFAILKRQLAKVPGRNFPLHLALGDHDGSMSIGLHDGPSELNSLCRDSMNEDPGARRESVKVTTLDRFCEEAGIRRIDILKIDTEGFEKQVVMGGKGMLSSGSVSFVYAETGFMDNDRRHTPFHQLKDLLGSMGYSFYALYGLSHASFLAGDYYGNALFVHKSVIR